MRAQVLYQIKCCGLLENVRIRKAGFAFRTTYELFVNKFRPLISNNLKGTPKDMCEMFLKDEKNSGTFHWKGGTTKVFLGNQHV